MAVSRAYIAGQLLLIGPVLALWLFSTSQIIFSAVMIAFIFYLFSLPRPHDTKREVPGVKDKLSIKFTMVLVALLLTSLLLIFYLNLLNPASAWDFITVDGWAEQALSLHQGKNGEVLTKHPNALKHSVSTLAGMEGAGLLRNAVGIFYSITLSGIVLTIYAHSRTLNNGVIISIIAALVPISIPLTFNHSALYGYSELILGASLLSSVSILSQHIARGDLRISGLLLSCLPLAVGVSVRNSGYVYCVAILLANVAAWLLISRSRQIGSRLFALRISGLALIIALPVIDFSWLLGTERFYAFGYPLWIVDLPGSEYFAILSTTYFRNQSFSLVYVSLFFGLLTVVPTLRARTSVSHNIWYGAVCVLLIAAAPITGLQINYVHQFAAPDNDTLFSRTHVPGTVLFGVFASLCFTQFQTQSTSRDIN